MNKKVIIISAIAVVVAVAVIVAIVFIVGGEKKVELNLQELNTAISGKAPFNEMRTEDIDSRVLTTFYKINEDEYEEVVGKMPMMNIQASMYLIIKAKDDTLESVKSKVEAYAQSEEEKWSTYLPEQYDIVKQRKMGVKGNYVYLIIAESATEIEELINK